MIVFYSGSGAGGFDILGPVMTEENFSDLKGNACKLLRARNKEQSAQILELIPFELSEGTNYFGDEFSVLHATVSIEEYVKYSEMKTDQKVVVAFREIAAVFSELGVYVRHIAAFPSSEKVSLVPQPNPIITSAAVERALKDSQQLLYSSGAASAVDRIHTALHGYMKAICINSNITFNNQASLTELFKELRNHHSAFNNISTATEEIKKLIGALSSIIDTLNTLRNNSSIAHPNDKILDEAEAVLALNCARSLLNYLDLKLR